VTICNNSAVMVFFRGFLGKIIMASEYCTLR
jgi:hypothetical protein